MFKRILCAVDFTEVSDLALVAALPIAEKFGAEIHIVHVLTRRMQQSYSGAEAKDIDYHKRFHQTKLDSLVSRMVSGAKHEVLIGESVSEETLKYARSHECDLILIGSHGRSIIGEIVLGSTTEELIRASEIPVMTIRPPEYAKPLQVQFDRILIPIDFSDTSLKALSLAMKFAGFLSAELHLIHIVDPLILYDLQQIHPDLDLTSTSKDVIRENINFLLQQAVETIEGSAEVVIATLFGDTIPETIQYAAREHCSFFVMGAHGRKPVERLLLGSVSRAVLSRIRIPMVMVSGLFRGASRRKDSLIRVFQ